MSKSFYITTTLPYVNAEPHVGHALEFIRADVIARSKKLQGFEVFFNTGTDEHGQKVYEVALAKGIDPQKYVDECAQSFKKLLPLLGISEDVIFTRTTDPSHKRGAQEFWKIVNKNGFIYKKNYKTRYCVGCEAEKTDSELVDGRCPIHPNRELEIREEENYFFKYSEFGEKLLKLYDERKHKIVPEFRMNEMREFIKRGLQDFSISRLKAKMPWGVGVPGDDEHVMYVWFDALPNYITALGWPENKASFDAFWKNGTPTQYCGKDNTRFQSIMWQAMLMAAHLSPTDTVVVDGFVTGEGGVKMSKSLGNGVDPIDVIKEYGTEAFRYFVCREIGSFEDSPFTMERFKHAYNTNLANGLGNLVSRVMKMATANGIILQEKKFTTIQGIEDADVYKKKCKSALEVFDIQAASNAIWELIGETDRQIQTKQPFKLIKSDPEAGKEAIYWLMYNLLVISEMLMPIMPRTAATIDGLVRGNKMPDEPLFLRRE
jgi:methionyl-tRNA synthetase